MKSVPSLSPHTNDVTGEDTFVTSALLDLVTDWTFVLTQISVGADSAVKNLLDRLSDSWHY